MLQGDPEWREMSRFPAGGCARNYKETEDGYKGQNAGHSSGRVQRVSSYQFIVNRFIVQLQCFLYKCFVLFVFCSDEESGPLFERRETEDADKDCTDSKPAESRIRNL